MTASCGHCGVRGAENGRHVIWAKQSGRSISGIRNHGLRIKKSSWSTEGKSSLCFLSNALSTEKPFFSRPCGVRCFTADIFIAWWHKPAFTGTEAMHNTRLKRKISLGPLCAAKRGPTQLRLAVLTAQYEKKLTYFAAVIVVVVYLAIKVKRRNKQDIP